MQLDELKKGITDLESFKVCASAHSQCASAPKGGYLGTFKRGDMVPNFDEAVFKGEVGTVLGPIKTIYGAHIIWVESRTTA